MFDCCLNLFCSQRRQRRYIFSPVLINILLSDVVLTFRALLIKRLSNGWAAVLRSLSSVPEACFLPGRAKDLSAPLYKIKFWAAVLPSLPWNSLFFRGCQVKFFFRSYRQNHVPWGRLSL